jgi:hypothetical protein
MMKIRPLAVLSFLALLSFGAASFTRAADPLSKRLVSTDPAIRERAIKQFNRLSKSSKEEYVPDLMMAVSSDDAGLSQDAQALLSKLGVTDRPDTATMQKTAKEEEAHPFGAAVRQNSVEELNATKEKEFGESRQQLENEKKAQYGSNATMQTSVIEALKDSDPMIRSHAARQLSTLRPTPVEAIPQLIELLKANDTESRGAAAAALGAMGPEARDAIPALTQQLGDGSTSVRQIVADALQQIRGQ